MNAGTLTTYSAVLVDAGQIRRLWFECDNEENAHAFCIRVGAGYEGRSTTPESQVAPPPEAYDERTTRELLGGISKSTLYRLLATGKLDRVPGTWRVLVTRRSVERLAGAK